MDEIDEKEGEKHRETNFDLIIKLRDAHNQTDSANPARRTFPLSPTIFPCTIHFSRSITAGKQYESFGDNPRKIITKSGETISVSDLKENTKTSAYHGLHFERNGDGVSAFMNVYEIQSDEVPDYNRNDFVEYFWLTRKNLLKRIAQGERMKGDLQKLVDRFYGGDHTG